MKLMIASDIHGSAKYCRLMLDRFVQEDSERLLLLGDLLYHGPRNDLPEEYNPKLVIEMLNGVKNKLVCVQGNCDAEVDQMVLEFPVMAEYFIFETTEPLVYATHGHHYGLGKPLPFAEGGILLTGHTHVPACSVQENYVYLNPGSVSIPKENSCHSYMVYQDGVFVWKELETGAEYMRYEV